jgi:hypothetical protein
MAVNREYLESLSDQHQVLEEALRIFMDRNKVYNDTWKTYGALSNLVRAAQKVDRMMEVWWHEMNGGAALGKDTLDDALDAINHLVFFIRCAREGNFTGAPPERPELVEEHGVVYHE